MRSIFAHIAIFVYLLLLPAGFAGAQQQVSATSSSGSPAAAEPISELMQIGREQNVLIETHSWEKGYWKVGNAGSGFIINDELVGTVAHVADLSPKRFCPPAIPLEQCILRLVVKTFTGYKLTGMHPAVVLRIDFKNDVAVLRVPTLVHVRPEQFAEDAPLDTAVVKTGNPLGVPNISTQGKVTSAEQARYLRDDPQPYLLVGFNALINNGDSGSAVRNNLAQVVGVTMAKSLKDSTGYMVAIHWLKVLLQDLQDHHLLVYKKDKTGTLVWKVRR